MTTNNLLHAVDVRSVAPAVAMGKRSKHPMEPEVIVVDVLLYVIEVLRKAEVNIAPW